MRSHKTFERILLHRKPVDGRKQINGLSCIAMNEIEDPQKGSLFVFVNKARDNIRLLYWDKTGFAMWVKRLEKERFRWPLRLHEDVIELHTRELEWILQGLDLIQLRPHRSVSFSAL